MSRWGPNEDENFIINDPPEHTDLLTASFAGNKKILITRQADNFVIYIDYTKGAETQLEMRVKYSFRIGDGNDQLFEDSIVSNSTGEVDPFVYVFKNSGTYRIADPLLVQEDQIEVAFRGLGAPDGSELVKVYAATSNLKHRRTRGC